MRKREPLLVLSASTGTGHRRAAEALREAGAALGVEVIHHDLLQLAPAWVRRLYGEGYEAVAQHAPALWRRVYRWSDGAALDRARWGPLAARLLFGELRRLLLGRPWAGCVATHFLPCQLAAGRPGLPALSLVMTDLTVHRFWMHPGVARFFVGLPSAADEVRRRIPHARVVASGIPVAAAFATSPSRAAAREVLGVGEGRLLLLTGGGLGIGVEAATRAALDALPPEAQVVAVCGRNHAARARLATLGVSAPRLRVLGYTDDMVWWMAAADAVAGKPGGLFTSEALALHRPLLLTRPIPGAEEGNARVVLEAGAGLAAADAAALRDACARIFREPGLLERLGHAARALGRPHAAPEVVQALLGTPRAPGRASHPVAR